jgi:hypothetical protein
MAYTRNEPVLTDDLDVSQPFLFNNTNAADDSFGVNHYKFSDLTGNNGKHSIIQTPAQSPIPVSAANEPVVFGYQITAPVGVLQYSLRGGSTVPTPLVPSPITSLQSPTAATTLASLGLIPILDFSGLSKAICSLYAFDSAIVGTDSYSIIWWTGTGFRFLNLGSSGLLVTNSGNVLNLQNTLGIGLNNIYWTLTFQRLQ